ncbi:unnamed protein product [Urochloa humidicola]
MDMDAIPIELLELILLFIVSPVFLRAALACKQWRRIIANADFLRRFRCLHRPPVASYYYDVKRFSPSSPSVVDSRYFSLDFLPGYYLSYDDAWRLKDSRGSLLLLEFCDYSEGSQDMVICEPVTKRFLRIPPFTALARYRYCYNLAYLLDGDNVLSGGISLSCFKVLCMVHYHNRIHAAIFASGKSWQETIMESSSMELIGLAMGSMYWYAGGRKVVTLDQSSNEFSSFTLPDIEDWDCHSNQHRIAITAGGDGMVRIVVGVTGGDMKIFAGLPAGGENCEWVLKLKKRIPLFMAMDSVRWREPWYFNPRPISNHRTGAVLIHATRVSLSQRPTAPFMFRLDIETMAVDLLPDPNLGIAYPCQLPWPPVFRALIDHGDSAT